MLLAPLLAQVGTATAADCALTGVCGLLVAERPLSSGLMFIAVGLVVLGVVGLRRRSA